MVPISVSVRTLLAKLKAKFGCMRLYQSQPLRRQHSRQDRLDRTVTQPGNPSPTTQGYQATRGAGSRTEIQGQHSQKSRRSGIGAVEATPYALC